MNFDIGPLVTLILIKIILFCINRRKNKEIFVKNDPCSHTILLMNIILFRIIINNVLCLNYSSKAALILCSIVKLKNAILCAKQ